MPKRFGAVATALVVAATPIVTMAPAQADTPGCVSKAEYRSVKQGWTKDRVNRVFDIKGTQSMSYPPYENRDYKACTVTYGMHGTVSITYKNHRVDSKMAMW